MSIAEGLSAELSHEAASTRKTLERIPEDRMGWKPHEKSFSFGQLGSHLVETLEWVDEILKTDEFSMSTSEYAPYAAADKAEILERFDSNVARFTEKLRGVPDEAMGAVWRMKVDGEIAFEMPRVAVLRAMILNHSVHHRGQLTVYLRLNGVSLPSIYGPSADERM